MLETQLNQQAAPAIDGDTSLLDSIIEQSRVATNEQEKTYTRDLIGELVNQVLAGSVTVSRDLTASIDARVAELDALLSTQLNAIMHHADFQKLEASWRGLKYLTAQSETSPQLKIKVLNASKKDLVKDLKTSPEFDQSALFKKIYEEEYGSFGGAPYAGLIGDYEFTRHPEDFYLLEELSHVAAAAHAPLITAASPQLFGLESFTDIGKPRDLSKIFDTVEYTKWKTFRESEDARYVGLVLPHVLGRLPYGADTVPVEAFHFEEDVDGADHHKYLWTNAAYAYGARMTDAFSQYGWLAAIRGVEGGGLVEGLPTHTFNTDDGEVALTEQEDGLQSWESTRQLVSSQTSLASFEYQAVSTHHRDDSTRIDQGTGGEQAQRSLEDYDPQTLYYGNPDDLARYTQLRQQAKDRQSKTFRANGSMRGLNVGEWFTLSGHPVHDQDLPEQRQFVITAQTFTAQNNLPGELQSGLASLLQVGLLTNRPTGLQQTITSQTQDASQPAQAFTTDLTLVRRGIALTPDYAHSAYAKPKANGVQTATVVGPSGEEIHTDALGRIKIQFHWQRPSEHPEFGANLDDRSSCWLRIAYPSAGAGWGHQFIPRIGQEVLVDFIEGDIDRPLITGVVYNGSHTPPEFSGAGSLPANKTLSGIKSKEYKGGQYNELLFDDTQNEVRTKLSSEHAKTQLNLGYLTHPRTEGKAEARGEGAELRTDASAAIRAAQGILLSTDARNGASDSQLARSELINHLQSALALLKGLGDSAETCHAFKTETDNQKALNQQLADWENGSNTAKGKPNGQSPIIALSSPGGISSATPKTTTHYAGEALNQIAGQHLQQTAGQQIKLNAGSGISLFSQKEGVRLIAHEGQFLAQAQTDDIAINAQKGVKITSSTEGIEVVAADKLTLVIGGGAYITLGSGKVEFGCPGSFNVKAGKVAWVGPASMNVSHPAFPQSLPKLPITLCLTQGPMSDKCSFTGIPYTLLADGKEIQDGIVDDSGFLRISHEIPTQKYELKLANGLRYQIPIVTEYKGDKGKGRLANQGFLKFEAMGDPQLTPYDDHARAVYSKLFGKTEE